MEERTFTWFPKLTRVMRSLPPELAAEFAVAVANYGTHGIEPSFENPIMEAVFEGVREDIDNSANNRSKNKGGRPSQKKTQDAPKNNPGSETEKPGFETPKTPVFENENPGFDTEETPVSESENPSYIYQAKPSHTKPSQDNPPTPLADEFGAEPGEFEEFAMACLGAFNDETGQDYRSSGGTDWLDLRRIFDNGRTVDDVRAVVRLKLREWGRDPKMRRYVRPSTLFGPKFEEYLAECGGLSAPPAAKCPECGHALVPIGDVVESPKDPSKLWCERCRKAIDPGEVVSCS